MSLAPVTKITNTSIIWTFKFEWYVVYVDFKISTKKTCVEKRLDYVPKNMLSILDALVNSVGKIYTTC